MIALTDQLRQAVQGHPEQPVRLVDPETQETFVLLRAEVYDRLQGMLYEDAECVLSEAYPLLDEMAAKAGYSDPAMDIYDDFAPRE